MVAERLLSIGEVVQRTGLTERTLRFYEEHGLIRPRRTPRGRRVYGATELATLHHVSLLKRASFSLAQIKQLLAASELSAEEILQTQIAALEAEREHLELALAALREARKSAARGAVADLEALCTLIRHGEQKMKTNAWQKIFDRYCTPEQQEQWRNAKLEAVKAAGFEPEGYLERWDDLIRRIEAALPLDPSSEKAQRFVEEWQALLAPLSALSDEMKAEAQAFQRQVARAPLEVDAPIAASALTQLGINMAVWEFIKAASNLTPGDAD